MYFYFFLLTNPISAALLLYDNTEQASSETIINKDPCIIQTTEHFSLKTGHFDSGKLILQSSHLIEEVMLHLTFLMDTQKHIYYSPNLQKWVIYLSFMNTYRYTPLTSDLLEVLSVKITQT